jgi:hypothetical protein
MKRNATKATDVTDFTRKKKEPKKKEDTNTTEYPLRLIKFWSGQVGVL